MKKLLSAMKRSELKPKAEQSRGLRPLTQESLRKVGGAGYGSPRHNKNPRIGN
jgi:hypothetical protein